MNATSKMTIRAAATRKVLLSRLTITYSSRPLIFFPRLGRSHGHLGCERAQCCARQSLPHCSSKLKYLTDHSSTQISWASGQVDDVCCSAAIVEYAGRALTGAVVVPIQLKANAAHWLENSRPDLGLH